jgi:hypothetical protein
LPIRCWSDGICVFVPVMCIICTTQPSQVQFDFLCAQNIEPVSHNCWHFVDDIEVELREICSSLWFFVFLFVSLFYWEFFKLWNYLLLQSFSIVLICMRVFEGLFSPKCKFFQNSEYIFGIIHSAVFKSLTTVSHVQDGPRQNER